MQITFTDYEARRRRDDGIAQLSTEWTDIAFRIVENERERGEFQMFSSDQIRKWTGNPDHPNQRGSLVLKLIKKKVIERMFGDINSTRPESHGRSLKMYRWCER